MKTNNDYTLIQHHFPSEIRVFPIADIHLGAIECNRSQWESFCRYIYNSDNAYIVLVGDLINNSVRNSVANPFDEIIRPSDQKKMMVDYLTPIRDRILCAVSGNHEQRSRKDSDIDLTYDIMSKLDLEDYYRENIAYMKVSCGNRPNGSIMNSYTFAVTHGAGGGIYTGASVNRNERFGTLIDGLDCLISAHSHAPAVTAPQKIVIDSVHNTVSLKTFCVVCCESWLKYAGYAARKMMSPKDNSNPQEIILSANSHRKSIDIRWQLGV